MPTISVIVPVYKVEAYLDRCIESILAQTYEDFELILVDDGSPDNCPAMCDSWAEKDSRIKVIHKKNGGLSDARNAGFEASNGVWISFIDSDDYVHPVMLQALYDAVQEHGVKISACNFTKTEGEPLVECQDLTANLWRAEDFYLQRNVNATVAWGKIYHRSIVLPYPKGKVHEDEFVTYRILFDCEQIAVLDAALYGYYSNPEGITKSKAYNQSRQINKLEAMEEQFFFFEQLGKIDMSKLSRHLWITTCHILEKAPTNKQRRKLAKFIKKLYPHMRIYLNRYDKLYVYFLRFSFGPQWVLSNDFEPIQNVLRMVKRRT